MSAHNWPDRTDERPYTEERRPSLVPLGVWLLLVLVALAGAAYFYFSDLIDQPSPPAGVTPRLSGKAPVADDQPRIRHPLPANSTAAQKPLPPLEHSDMLMRDLASGLIGRQPFDSMVIGEGLIRRIVSTVDNLPRATAPVRARPLRPVPGQFTPGAANTSRYEPYVRALESIDARALGQAYVKLYPLFQAAYVELGYPDRYFNDRLVEAIDDLLSAPDLTAMPELVQPKVFYQYANPDLEGRSAGQKIMMRLGAEKAARVKTKLREIRREVAS